jgi:acyl-CoA thioester hydrolase
MPGDFRIETRVRLAETDALGVVYYGEYLTYFDMARLELLRKAGITPRFLRSRGLGFVAGESACRYVSSAKFDDVLNLMVKVSRIGNSSVAYSHRVTRGRRKVAEGTVTDILVGTDGKPRKIPSDIRAKLSRFK